jgi:hypothetical protein
MRSHGIATCAAGAALALAPLLASAEDANVEARMLDMKAHLQQLEDKIQAADDQLQSANTRVDEQSQIIEESGLANTRGTSSGLPGFLGELTITGSVSADYFYNLNDPNDHDLDGLQGTNQGINGAFYPLTPDHNSFAFQAAWFEIEREISEERRSGFRFDTAWGKTGQLDNVGGISNREDRDDTGLYISQGYVQYLAPVGDGLTFKFGKFGTTIGYEVANTAYNWNITHGSVYQLLEPLDHIGILANYAFGDSGFDATIGGVNGYFPDDPDRNDAKSILWHFGWGNDRITAGVNGIWGGEQTAFDGNESGVVNGVLSMTVNDRFGFWINADYDWIDADGDPNAWGVAAAARFGITDRTGIALRAEYVTDSDQYLGFTGEFDPATDAFRTVGVNIMGITATLDHLLTDNLMIRGEVRYDRIDKDNGSNDEFFQNSSNDGPELSPDQIVLGVEAIYNFDKFGGD